LGNGLGREQQGEAADGVADLSSVMELVFCAQPMQELELENPS
jgi:hypothetical protein